MAAAVVFRKTDADGYRAGVAQRMQDVGAFDALKDLFCDTQRALEVCSGKNDSEFVAAAAEHEIRVTYRVFQGLRDLGQHLVSDDMTERIVHDFERIDIYHEQRERRRIAVGTSGFTPENFMKEAGVVYAGQRISDSGTLQFGKESCIFERYCGEIRQCGSRCDVIVRKGLGI